MFADSAIKDDQLRMMFSCCHPRLPEEAQVMLILHVLCGFGIGEVASAFMTAHTAVEKRIPRAKKVLAGSKRLFNTQAAKGASDRLPAVQRALYLLFNEGYHGASAESRYTRSFAKKRCGWPSSCWNIRLGQRPARMRFQP